MPIDVEKYNDFLTSFAEELDIPPGKYQQAVERYKAVGKWLEEGNYEDCKSELRIYPQGSFRLGTVTRPVVDGKEADYDIDLVCELPKQKKLIDPGKIKSIVGDRLNENSTYKRMLDKEGKRCWTLNYAEQDNIGFHIDVLPCIPENRSQETDTPIALTHKNVNDRYDWSSSDPIGYAAWFEDKNKAAFLLVEKSQRTDIAQNYSAIYASVDDVPPLLIKTPLQRVIQIMKRHRDIRFNGHSSSDYRPISMIITTLAAILYENEGDVFSAVRNIVEKLHAHASLMKSRVLLDSRLASINLIQKREDGTWYIGNPVNKDENFADRWHEDNHARARAFFTWVEWLKSDLVDILSSTNSQNARKLLTEGMGVQYVNKNFQSIWAVPAVPPHDVTPHKVSISHNPKPWRRS